MRGGRRCAGVTHNLCSAPVAGVSRNPPCQASKRSGSVCEWTLALVNLRFAERVGSAARGLLPRMYAAVVSVVVG